RRPWRYLFAIREKCKGFWPACSAGHSLKGHALQKIIKFQMLLFECYATLAANECRNYHARSFQRAQ
ncbi:MAG TPA: hypothetical protein DCP61_02310, partial [Treponema sp.]|nr:hypothetical protein [Treponema sp.]